MKPGILLYSHTEKPSRDGIGGPTLVLVHDGEGILPDTLVEMFPFFEAKLRSPENVAHIVESTCLIDDEFEGDETFAFKTVEYKNFMMVYTFENSAGTVLEVPFSIESVSVA